jgi:hypothetical protein
MYTKSFIYVVMRIGHELHIITVQNIELFGHPQTNNFPLQLVSCTPQRGRSKLPCNLT